MLGGAVLATAQAVRAVGRACESHLKHVRAGTCGKQAQGDCRQRARFAMVGLADSSHPTRFATARFLAFVFAFLAGSLPAERTDALQVVNYIPSHSDRFSSGYPASPVANTDPAFLGRGYDFSGVGWLAGSENRSYALLSPRHYLYSSHYPAGVGTTIQFSPADRQVKGYVVGEQSGWILGDFAVGTFAAPIPAADNVHPSTILFKGYSFASYAGSSLLLYGHPARVGTNRMGAAVVQFPGDTGTYYDYKYDATPDQGQLISGDSGSPTFIVGVTPGVMYLSGAHYANYNDGSGGVDTMLPLMLNTLNATLARTGYLPYLATPATAQWTGTTPDWATAGNWSNNRVPADVLNVGKQVTATASIEFDAARSSQRTVQIASLQRVTAIAFNSSPGVNPFVLSGTGTLTIGETGIVNRDDDVQTISCPVALRTSQRWDPGSGGLNVSGTIALDTSGPGNLLLVEGAGNAVLSGAIAGAGGLAKDGAGTLTLSSGGNTFTGKSFLHGGTLALGRDDHLGAAPASLVADQLTIDGGTLRATDNVNLSANRGTTLGLAGGTLAVDSGKTLTISGPIAGAGNLTAAGPATVLLSSASGNTYTGGTIINGGILALSGTGDQIVGSVQVNSGGSLRLDQPNRIADASTITLSGGTFSLQSNRDSVGAVTLRNGALIAGTPSGSQQGIFYSAGPGNRTQQIDVASATTLTVSGPVRNQIDAPGGDAYQGSLLKTGPGTLVLSGANAYTGGTTVSQGTLTLSGSAGTIASSSAYTVANSTLLIDNSAGNLAAGNRLGSSSALALRSGLLQLVAAPGGSTESLGGISAALGENTVTFSGGMTVVSGGAFSRSAGAVLNFTGTPDYGRVAFNNVSGFLSQGAFAKSSAASAYAVYDAAGYVRPMGIGSGSSDYTNNALSSNRHAYLTSAVSGQASVSPFTLTLGGNGANVTLAAGGTLTLQYGGMLKIGGGTATVAGGNGVSAPAGVEYVLCADSSADQLVVNGAVAGGNGLTKAGQGVLVLAGANTYPGPTTINAGTLKLGASEVIPNGAGKGDLLLNGGLSAGAFDLAGFNETINGLWGTSGAVPGQILNSGPGTTTLTVGAGNAAGAFAGTIQDNAGTGGTLALAKTGSGTLTLSGANAYSGGTTITGGILSVSADNHLGAAPGTAAVNLTLSGGTLQYGAAFSLNANRSVLLGSGGGTIDTNNTSDAIGSAISGPGGLTKAGNGTLTLSGTNSYAGGTTVSGGTLSVSTDNGLGAAPNTAAVNLTLSGGTLQYGAAFSLNANRSVLLGSGGGTINTNNSSVAIGSAISGTGGLTKAGAGTLTLAGSNSYAGGTTVSGGVLKVAADDRLGAAPGTAAVNLTLAGGTLQYGAAFALNANRSVLLGAGGGTIDTNGTSDAIAGAISGPGGLTKAGVGTLTLSGANSYSGGTTVSGGALNVAADDKLGAAPGTAAVNLTLAGGTLQYGAAFALNPNRSILLGSGGGTIDTNNTSDAIASLISGTGGLTKAGAGTLTLSATNTYTGGTTVSGGVLRISADNNLGAVPSSDSTNLTLSGGTLRYGAAFSLAPTRAVVLGSGGGTFDTDNTSDAVASPISGAGPLTKIGAGTLTLTGVNSFSGGTTVGGGVLNVSGDYNLGAVPATPATNLTLAGGTLRYAAAFTLNANRLVLLGSAGGTIDTGGTADTISSVISGPGALTKAGYGTLTLNGANTFSGGATIALGTLRLGNASALGTGPLTLNSGGTLELNGISPGVLPSLTGAAGATIIDSSSGTGTAGLTLNLASGTSIYAGAISRGTTRDISLVKNGSGTLVLSGTNNYTGSTTVSGGVLQANDGAGLPTGSFLSLGGILQSHGTAGFTRALGSTGPTFAWKSGSTGFSATGGKLTVNVGGQAVPTRLTWGTDILGTLRFGSATASAETEWRNPIDLAGLSRIVEVTAGTGGDFTTLSGVISNSTGTAGIIKTGNGTLRLSTANTCNGVTTVAAGTLQFLAGGVNPVGQGSTILVAGGADATHAGTFDLAGLDQTVGGLSGGSGAAPGRVTNSGSGNGANTLTVGANDASTTFSGQLLDGPTARLALTKVGRGTLTLSGDNSYTGPTRVSGGNLLVSDIRAVPSGSPLFLDGGATMTLQSNLILSGGGATMAGGGNPLAASAATPRSVPNTVPEPATLLLVAVGGLAWLAGWLWRRARR